MLTPLLTRWLAGLMIFFALPLYFTKLIRETRIPEGIPFVVVYTWGLISVVAVPVLLLVHLYFLLRYFKGAERGPLLIAALALCFGIASECVFLLARR
jgi:hypothetical protein